jgi:hypothetical protein
MAVVRRRRWPRRVAAAVGWLWALWFVYLGLPYRLRFLALALAVLFTWLAFGVWKGAPRRSLALGVLGVLGAAWFVRAMFVEWRDPFDGSVATKPKGWYVIVGIEASFALGMGLLSLLSWRRATPGTDPAQATEGVDV